MPVSRLQQLNEQIYPDESPPVATPVAPSAPASPQISPDAQDRNAAATPPPAPTIPPFVNPAPAVQAPPPAPAPHGDAVRNLSPADYARYQQDPNAPEFKTPQQQFDIVFPDGSRVPYTPEKWQELQQGQRDQKRLRDIEYNVALGDALRTSYKPAGAAPIEGTPEATSYVMDQNGSPVERVPFNWQGYIDTIKQELHKSDVAAASQQYGITEGIRQASPGASDEEILAKMGSTAAERERARLSGQLPGPDWTGTGGPAEALIRGVGQAGELPGVKQAGMLIDGANRAWQSMLGRMLIATDGGTAQFNELTALRMKKKGITNPNWWDAANEAGELAGEVWRQASESGPAFVGGLAEAANPAWWVSGAAGVSVGRSLLVAGVSPRIAGFVESAIANGGLPYADRALNAVFINGFTRGVARSLGDRALQTIGDPADLVSALHAAIPDGLARFTGSEAGGVIRHDVLEVALREAGVTMKEDFHALGPWWEYQMGRPGTGMEKSLLDQSITARGNHYGFSTRPGESQIAHDDRIAAEYGFTHQGRFIVDAQGNRVFEGRTAAETEAELHKIATTGYTTAATPEPPRFLSEDTGGLNTQRLRELFALTRYDASPRSLIAALRKLAAENDDPALRARLLGPGGGLSRVGGAPPLAATREGSGLVVGQTSQSAESGALRTHRADFVDPYSSVADELDKALSRIDDIDHSAMLEWGSQTTEEQLRRLAINEPDGDWEAYLAAFRQASTDEEQAAVLEAARAHGLELSRLRGAPILDGPFLPGDDASTLLSEQQVLIARAKVLMQDAAKLLVSPKRPTEIPQTYGIRPKVIKGRQSKTSFDIVDPQGRVVATARSEKDAAQRAHDLNVAAASEQTQIPGTPPAQAGDLVLQNQDVSDAAARAARGPAGEQGMLADIVPIDQKLEARAQKLADSGDQAFVMGNTVVNGTTRTRIESFPNTRAAQDYADKLNERAIAKASEVFASSPAATLEDSQIEGGLAGRIGGKGSLGVPEEGAGPMGAQNVARETLAKETAQRSKGQRFEVRDGKIFDTQTGKVDEILSARADEVAHTSETTAMATRTRWASWANKKVASGTWREHQPIVPEGQKLVPEDAKIVPPGTPDVPPPPSRPPKQPPLIPEEPRNIAEEGPNPVITRVVDNKDGTFGLGTVDLEKGVVIKGERFASREGAVITAEARNAANEAVTMTQNARDTLSLLEGIPDQLALMSPGQAAAVNRALAAEKKLAQQELERTMRDVDRARATYRRRLANDPGFGVKYPGSVPPGRIPAGGTPIELPGGSLIGNAARESIGVFAHLRGLTWKDIPGAAATVSRLIGTGYDAGGIARQAIILGLRHPKSFASMIRATFETYLSPEVVTQRAHELYAEALSLGGDKLHYRGQGEFGGEALASEKVTAAIEAVPVAGEGLRRSQLSFNNGLNLFAGKSFVGIVRADARAVAKWNRAHPDRPRATMSQETKDRLAWRINHQLGYGYDPKDLGERARFIHDLASGLYAPEWQASRVAVMSDFGKAIGNIVRGKADAADKEAFWNGALFVASNVSVLVGGASALGVDVEWDPHATNFARLPLGQARPELVPWTTALSALGVGVQTYDDGTVWADFSAGIGPDLRLLAQLFPVSDLSFEGIGHGKVVSSGGNVSDPYNPQGPYDRNAAQVAADWLTSRGAPGVRFTKEIVAPRTGDQRDMFARARDALISAYIPMTLQDSVESSGALREIEWDRVLEDFKNGQHWFSSPTNLPTVAPSTRPGATIAPSTGGSLYDKYGR